MALVLTQLAADTFHRANETLQDPPWHAADGGPCQIVSNQMMSIDLNEDAAIYNGVTLPSNQYIQWSMLLPAQNGSQPFVLLRTAIDESTGYSLRITAVDGTHISLGLQAGFLGPNIIDITSTAFLTSDVFVLAVVGSNFTLLQNGAVLGTATDSSIVSGNVGFDLSPVAAITDCIITNFACGSAANASNNFISNPIIVGGAVSTKVSLSAGTSIPPGGWVIDHIRWYNPVSPGDTFLITLGDGTTKVLQDYCVTAHKSVDYPMYGLKLQDFQVPTLGSGTLYIYFR